MRKNIYQNDADIQARKNYYDSLDALKRFNQNFRNLSVSDKVAYFRSQASSCCSILIYWDTDDQYYDLDDLTWES